jgi:hypothetical protein
MSTFDVQSIEIEAPASIALHDLTLRTTVPEVLERVMRLEMVRRTAALYRSTPDAEPEPGFAGSNSNRARSRLSADRRP